MTVVVVKMSTPIGGVVASILVSCLVTAGSAVVMAIIIAVVDMYLSGHAMTPKNWLSMREWAFRGSLVVVFVITLVVSLKTRSSHSFRRTLDE